MAKRIVLVVLSFFALVCTVCLVLALTVLATMAKPAYLEKKLAAVHFYDTVYTLIQTNATSFGLAAGIPSDVTGQAVTEEVVHKDVDRTVQQYYDYLQGRAASPTLDIAQSSFLPALRAAVNGYAQKQQVNLQDKYVSQAVETYLTRVSQKYNDGLALFPYAKQAAPYLRTALRLLPALALGSAVLLIVLTALACAAAGRGNRSMGLIHGLYGLMAGGALVACGMLLLLVYDLPAHFVLFTGAIQQLAETLLSGFAWTALVAGYGLTAASLVAALVVLICTRRRFGW